MKIRPTAVAALALLAACSETPVDPAASLDVSAPSFAISPVSLSNPSFESGYVGWSFPGTPGQYVDIGPFWVASDGVNSVDLNGFDAGWISQDITTVAGVQYTVAFDLAGNPGSPQGVKSVEVSAAGATATYSFDTTGKSTTNMGWTPETFTFTATGTTTTLMFKSLYNGAGFPDDAQGPAVDNVRVTFDSGPANPTTVDQCKKGGWAQYGFRNQGLCIQFVNTGKDSR